MSSNIPTFTKETIRVLSYALRAVAGLHVFTSSCFELSQTEGASMLPTLQVQNDFCIVDKRFKYGRGIQMGDMIVARKPTQPESWICKRITGMPGDIILIDRSAFDVRLVLMGKRHPWLVMYGLLLYTFVTP